MFSLQLLPQGNTMAGVARCSGMGPEVGAHVGIMVGVCVGIMVGVYLCG